MPNEPGTLVWYIEDSNGEVLGELIVSWSARHGNQQDPDWHREIHAWRIATFLPGNFGLLKQQIAAGDMVDGSTPYVRNAQANELWNDFVLTNGVQPGTTAAEFRGQVGPIPNFVL